MAVSWNWGRRQVADTKDHGNITIKSKRRNTIKKSVATDNLAVHLIGMNKPSTKPLAEKIG
jgi:hypothetical protein